MEVLERALESSHRIVHHHRHALDNPGRYPLLHQGVCGLLAEAYQRHLLHLHHACSHAASSIPSLHLHLALALALRELLRIVLQGEHFVRLCCDSNAPRWPQRALLLAPSRDGLLVHLHDFLWCVWGVHHALHASETQAAPNRFAERFASDFFPWEEPYGDLERRDADALMRALREMVLKRRNDDEHRIGKFLIRRLAHQGGCVVVPQGEFILKDVLGSGSSGSIQAIEWLGQEFAEKRIFCNEDTQGNEAAILARMCHPHVVFFVCYSRGEKYKSLVMERMQCDLGDFIEARRESHCPPFRLAVAVDMMLQIATGMAYIHSRDVIHRDLKPSNILVEVVPVLEEKGYVRGVNEEGYVRLKVADFGLSTILYDTEFTVEAGTGCWRAPETVASKGRDARYTPKADVYSFAMVFYEILTGELPRSGNDKSIISGWRPAWPAAARVPVYLSSYIQRCWDAEPMNRPSFAEIGRTLARLKAVLLRSESQVSLLLSSSASIEQMLETLMPTPPVEKLLGLLIPNPRFEATAALADWNSTKAPKFGRWDESAVDTVATMVDFQFHGLHQATDGPPGPPPLQIHTDAAMEAMEDFQGFHQATDAVTAATGLMGLAGEKIMELPPPPERKTWCDHLLQILQFTIDRPLPMKFLEQALASSRRIHRLYQVALEHPGRYPLLHKGVCGLLADAYQRHLPQLRDRLLYAFHCTSRIPSDLGPALRELSRIVHHAERFVGLCCDHNSDRWPQRAILLAPSRDGIFVHLHDLLWCVCVVHQAIHAAAATETGAHLPERSTPNFFWSEKPYGDLALDSSVLEAVEEEDADALIQALRGMVERRSQDVHDNEYRIAELLIHRLTDSGVVPGFQKDPQDEIVLKDVLGSGNGGSVQAIEWLGQEFAEKRIFRISNLERFNDEAAILGTLRHPNAVFFLCCYRSKKYSSMVMERMEQDLGYFIKERSKRQSPPFSLPVAVDIMLQIAKGMAYVHSRNIIHRDLKPANILVDVDHDKRNNEDGYSYVRVKLTDFGESKCKPPENCRFTSPMCGTGYWRAPELFFSEEEDGKNYTLKADVYSFAIVCYEILTGKRPWKSNEKSSSGWRPPWPPEARIPVYLSSYIRRCWDAEPANRPCFAQICKTLTHLKGVLLRCQSPENVALLSSPVSIEQQLETLMKVDNGKAATAYTQLCTMPYEMFAFRAVEDALFKPKPATLSLKGPQSPGGETIGERRKPRALNLLEKCQPRLCCVLREDSASDN